MMAVDATCKINYRRVSRRRGRPISRGAISVA
jgi:hypothetical protein